MKQEALLLCEGSLLPNDQKLCRILDFFGIPWKILTLDKMAGQSSWQKNIQSQRYCILGPMHLMAQAIEYKEGACAELLSIVDAADSVYLYSSESLAACNRLLQFLTDDPNSETRQLESTQITLMVSDDDPDFCGPMSGLRLQMFPSDCNHTFHTFGRDARIHHIISSDEGQFFINLVKYGVHFFLNASCQIIDIELPVEKGFYDIKDHFCSAVPLVMYLKWAFYDVVWKPQEIGACLIVDDPLLKPQYGFFDFKRTLEL